MSINNDIKARVPALLERVKEKKPLVHHITNYVTVNDCANAVLAIGGSPIMADDIGEMHDIVSMASALVLNIGTLNERTIESMIIAGKRANELGIPVVFDPVGAGATRMRDKTANRIIDEVKLAVIRGNISEIKAVSGIASRTKGVDAAEEDMLSSGNLDYGKKIAMDLSRRLDCVVAITGPVDIVAEKDKVCFVENGDKMLSTITGSGCVCTSIIAVYCGVTGNYFDAAVAGLISIGIAGEMAREMTAVSNAGSGTYREKLIDSLYLLTAEDIQKRGKVSCHET
ncbi:MAG: hydroxyethylthiazole kinase [Clostridiaceae bacterium]|nr:hydroxyethylthiazole kinase [Clostridiaceae bacterium]